ncbi:MAG: SPASM domain-containing protein [Cyclobacteriaceae bacterium]
MFISLRDTILLISKLTFPRIINGLKVLFSYFFSRVVKNPMMAGLPISIAIEPTTSCNLRCPECPSGLRSFTRPTGMLNATLYEKIIKEASLYTSYLTLYFQGEPFLHKDINQLIKYASDQKMYTATSTNAHYIDDQMAKDIVSSGLNRLIISIDGTDQTTYEVYRKGGDLEKVFKASRLINKWKKKLKANHLSVIWQFLVVRQNEHQVDEVRALAQSYGVDKVAIKTAQVYDFEKGNDLIPTNPKYSRYRKGADGSYRLNNQLLDHCWKMWSSAVITWDGRMVPCCFDKDAAHVMGNLSSASMYEVWYGSNYQMFRKLILKSRKEVDICKNCTEGAKIWA